MSGVLGMTLLPLQRFDEIKARTTKDVEVANDKDLVFHNVSYALAFLRSDSSGMAEQQRWFAAQPDYQDKGFHSPLIPRLTGAPHKGPRRQNASGIRSPS